VAADEFWLSPAYGCDSLAIHFTWRPDTAAVAVAVGEIEAALAPFGARPHWAKVSTVSPPELATRFPRLTDAAARRQTFDPTGVFRNDFLDTALGR
jgi:xylitol oxidase